MYTNRNGRKLDEARRGEATASHGPIRAGPGTAGPRGSDRWGLELRLTRRIPADSENALDMCWFPSKPSLFLACF